MSTRDFLLDVGEKLARSRGFDAFSYADLSDQVGIRKASIHHHFPTKADLALALISRYREQFSGVLATISDEARTGSARLLGFLDAYRAALQGGRAVCLCVAFSAGRESLSESVRSELDAFHEEGLKWLRETFETGQADGSIQHVGEPSMEANAALALVEGAQLMARAAEDMSRYDAATKLLRQRARAQ